MPLDVGPRKGRAGLWISGTVRPAGAVKGIRVRRRAGSDDPRLAREEATALEAQILRDHHLGRRRAAVPFSRAVASYLKHEARSEGTKALVRRLLLHFADTPLEAIGQEAVDKAREALLEPGHAPATATRNVVAPVRAILTHAAKRGWCDHPRLEAPAAPKGRTAFLLPEQFEAVHAAAAPHLRPLLTWLVCTGCRMGESLALDWSAVDLISGQARLWADTTKGEKVRIVRIPPAAVAALAGLPARTGRVFLDQHGEAYPDSRETGAGGQIRWWWEQACRAAGVDATPHDLRHTWATWDYALHRDPFGLRERGGWSSVVLVERYAHLMPSGHEAGIRRVWGLAGPAALVERAA